MRILLLPILCLLCLVTGCSKTSQQHGDSLPTTKEREFTLGLVQKEIRQGMSGAEVVEALGQPNMVTKNSLGNETWVYDKIASEAYYSKSSSGAAGGLVLGLWPVGVGFGGGGSKSAGAASSTQKTLTVVIKFDEDNKVSEYSYHLTKF